MIYIFREFVYYPLRHRSEGVQEGGGVDWGDVR